jgi:hypothetical protein
MIGTDAKTMIFFLGVHAPMMHVSAG